MNTVPPKPSGHFNSEVKITTESKHWRTGGVEIEDRLAVCSWSLQPDSPDDLTAKLRGTRIRRVQLALNPLRESPAIWSGTARIFQAADISLVSGMFGCVGEDYSTLESIRATGGIAPDPTWEQNLKNIRVTVKLATELEMKLVTFHAGFLPDDDSDPNFAKMLERLNVVAEIFAREKIGLALETGQEAAPVLAAVLNKLNHPNLGVNFDPANMILYGSGDPIEALRTLGPWIRQVHIKDARRTQVPGTWGEEVVAGTGQVDWRIFFSTLKKLNFIGDFVIEREAGTQRAADIRTAREVVLNSIG
jgi:L-ribulose-5-phosphate 3-epimerase